MRLMTSLLMATLFVVVGTSSAAAGPDVSTEDRVVVRHAGIRQPVGTILDQALAHVGTKNPLMRADAMLGGQARISNASGGGRKKWLTIGLIGLGTAVAGAFVYEKKEYNLPGLVSGRQVAGETMLFGGAVFGGLGFWKAFTND